MSDTIRWDVDEAAVVQVLQRVVGIAKGYGEDAASLSTSLAGLEGALQRSPLVHKAVADFAQQVLARRFEGIAYATGSALDGTAKAVSHYHEGQELMSAQAQCAAKQAADLPVWMPGGQFLDRGPAGAVGAVSGWD